MFELATGLIGLVVVAGVCWSLFGVRDTLHPLTYLMPMSGFLYIYMPIQLYRNGDLASLFTAAELNFIQSLNLLCVLFLALGVIAGGRALRRTEGKTDTYRLLASPQHLTSVYRLGILFGLFGFLLYVYQISNVGGFIEAYDNPKGGGYAASGYLRDLKLLVIPGILFLYISQIRRKAKLGEILLIMLFSSPLLLHGLLSARRGPTFLALAALIGGWYLARNRRPGAIQVLTGGGIIGLLLLVLVSFRGEIYLGSDFFSQDISTEAVVEKALANRAKSTYENEFIYGTYVVHNVRSEGYFYYGRRYLTQIFIRPIPSQVWPDKYKDTGMEAMLENAGILGPKGLDAHPHIPPGAAPGFAASAFVEFWWGALAFVFFIGWLYGTAWRYSLVRGGIWTLLYTCLMTLSAYFIAQSFLAVLFRVLIMCLPAAVVWRWTLEDVARRPVVSSPH